MRFAVIDVETRVDKELLAEAFFAGQGLSPDEAYLRQAEKLKAQRGSDFFPVPLHRPVSAAVGDVAEDYSLVSVESLAGSDCSEEKLVREFWDRLGYLAQGAGQRARPCLVTFNGRRFDLPVMELAALRHELALARYFDGRSSPRARYSEESHIDLLDFVTNYGAFALAGGMNLLLKMIGLRGKGEIDGSMVQQIYEAGRLAEIHRYCREDVIQTYFLLLRVQRLRGRLDEKQCQAAWEKSRPFLEQLDH